MGEYFPGEIWIGGPVGIEMVTRLCKAIEEQGVQKEWGTGAVRPSTSGELMEYVDGQHLHFVDDQASFGQFDELESFCKGHEIAYDRRSDPYGEFPEETVMFRSGMEEHVWVPSISGDEVLDKERCKRVLRNLRKLLKITPGDPRHEKLVESTIQIVVQGIGADIPKLPRFRIIG